MSDHLNRQYHVTSYSAWTYHEVHGTVDAFDMARPHAVPWRMWWWSFKDDPDGQPRKHGHGFAPQEYCPPSFAAYGYQGQGYSPYYHQAQAVYCPGFPGYGVMAYQGHPYQAYYGGVYGQATPPYGMSGWDQDVANMAAIYGPGCMIPHL
jgi:hypothetical protein